MTACEYCEKPITQPATGRPRRFCSDACRMRARRRRLDPEVGSQERFLQMTRSVKRVFSPDDPNVSEPPEEWDDEDCGPPEWEDPEW